MAPSAALALLVALLVVGAWKAFPLWDDAWLWLLLDERGPGAVAASFADRPVNGALWGLLARAPGGLWPAAFLAQALLWLLLGLFAARLWVGLFPGSRRLAWLVACLTVAPIWAKVQLVTVNVGLASLPPVVLGYAALLSIGAFVRNSGRRGARRAVAGAGLLAAGVLYQEYAVAVAAVALVLIAPLLWPSRPAGVRRRAAWALAAVVTVTAGAYLLFVRLADFGVRQDTDPAVALRTGRALLALPLEIAGALWRGAARGPASTAAELADLSTLPLLGLGLGALLAILLLLGARDQAEPGAAVPQRALGEISLLLAATLAGLAPIVAMGRVPWDPGDGMTTRFALPVLPILAALVVRSAERLLPRRAWPALVVVGALLAGGSSVLEVGRSVGERRLLGRLGAALEERAARNSGLTIAVVELPERSLGPRRQWELAVRLAADWPASVRRRFWAYRLGGGPPLYYREEATRVFGPRTSCRPPRRWKTGVRLVRRQGPVSELLRVAPGPDGAADIGPYCRPPRSPRSGG